MLRVALAIALAACSSGEPTKSTPKNTKTTATPTTKRIDATPTIQRSDIHCFSIPARRTSGFDARNHCAPTKTDCEERRGLALTGYSDRPNVVGECAAIANVTCLTGSVRECSNDQGECSRAAAQVGASCALQTLHSPSHGERLERHCFTSNQPVTACFPTSGECELNRERGSLLVFNITGSHVEVTKPCAAGGSPN